MDISLQAQGHQGLSDLRAFAQAVTSALHRAPTSSAYRKLCPDPQTWSDQRLTASPPSGGNYPRPGGAGVNRTNVESTPTTGRALCLSAMPEAGDTAASKAKPCPPRADTLEGDKDTSGRLQGAWRAGRWGDCPTPASHTACQRHMHACLVPSWVLGTRAWHSADSQ